MIVERSQEWGEEGPLPDGGVMVGSDAEARDVVERARRDQRPLPALGLLGGDLCRTLGGRGDEERILAGEGRRVTVDVGVAVVDGRRHWFVAHLVARRSWWYGSLWAAMNAEFIGAWDVAPRAHPNDGLLDVVTVGKGLGVGDRIKARSRLPRGEHLPHPDIGVERSAHSRRTFEPGVRLWLDGVRVGGTADDVSVQVEPDALVCVV